MTETVVHHNGGWLYGWPEAEIERMISNARERAEIAIRNGENGGKRNAVYGSERIVYTDRRDRDGWRNEKRIELYDKPSFYDDDELERMNQHRKFYSTKGETER